MAVVRSRSTHHGVRLYKNALPLGAATLGCDLDRAWFAAVQSDLGSMFSLLSLGTSTTFSLSLFLVDAERVGQGKLTSRSLDMSFSKAIDGEALAERSG